jgi:hypothetical protein
MSISRRFAGWFVLLLGALSLFSRLGNPRVRALPRCDVFALVGAVLCLGAGLAVILGYRMTPPK